MNVLLGKTPKMTREVSSKTVENRPLATENIQLKRSLPSRITLTGGGRKNFLNHHWRPFGNWYGGARSNGRPMANSGV